MIVLIETPLIEWNPQIFSEANRIESVDTVWKQI